MPWLLAWLSACQAAVVGGWLTTSSCLRKKEGVNTNQPPQRRQPKTNAGGTRQGQAQQVRCGASPAPLPRRGPAAGTMSPIPGPPPHAPHCHPVKPEVQAPGLEIGTTASGKPTRAQRATGPDEVRRSTPGHEARQRGTPPATTKAHGQMPSNKAAGCRKPGEGAQHATNHGTRRDAKQHQPPSERKCARPAVNRAPAGYRTAAVRMDECAPGGYPAPAGYETAAVRMDECAPGGDPAPAGYKQPPSEWTSERPAATPRTRNTAHATHSTAQRASTPVNRSQVAQDTAHPTQHTERAHR